MRFFSFLPQHSFTATSTASQASTASSIATGYLIGIIVAAVVVSLLLVLGVAYKVNRNRKKANIISTPFQSPFSSVAVNNPLYDAAANEQSMHESTNYAEPTGTVPGLYSELNYGSTGKGNYAEPTYAGADPQYALANNDTAASDGARTKKGEAVYSNSSKHNSFVHNPVYPGHMYAVASLNEEEAMA